MLKKWNVSKFVILIVIGFTITTFLTYPLIAGLKTFYPIGGDYSSNGWTYWYVSESFKNLSSFNLKSFYDSSQFYPFKNTLAQLDFQLFTSILIFGPIFNLSKDLILSVNTLVFLSFIATFLSSFYSINYFVKRTFPSILGSIIFTFSPPVMSHFIPGHTEYLTRFFIPPLLAFGVIFFNNPTLKRGLLFFTFLILNLITSVQMFIFSLILLGVIFLINLVEKVKSKDLFSWILRISKPTLLFLIIVPFIWIFYSPYLSQGFKREVDLLIVYSPTILDFFMGLPENLLLGDFYKSLEPTRINQISGYGVNYGERTLFPGFLALIAIIYLFLGKIKSFSGNLKTVSILSILTTYILATGPFMTLYAKTFPLPYYFIYQILTPLQFIRTPARIYLIGIFFISLISALFFKQILESLKGKKGSVILITILFALFLVLEYKNNLTFSTYSDIGFNYNLKDKKVVFLPFAEADNRNYQSRYLTLMTSNQFLMVNGATGSTPVGFDEIHDKLQDLKFDEVFYKTLKQLDVEYVIIDRNKLNDFPEIRNEFLNKEKSLNEMETYRDNNWIIYSFQINN